MLASLAPEARLTLMKFVCAVAWSDLKVSGEERLFVADCIRRLQLDEAERRQVWQWLEVPPAPADVDPADVPPAHRRIFVEALGHLVKADDQVTPEERESLVLLCQLIT
jgi:uncharacterized tellurite resistance protein B-like protein